MKDTANGSSHTRSNTLNQQSGAVQRRIEQRRVKRKEKMAKMKKETDEGDKEKKRIMRGNRADDDDSNLWSDV